MEANDKFDFFIEPDFDFFTKRKLKGVGRVLAGEKIINAIYGDVDISMMGQKQEGKSGVLVLTPTRVISYRKRFFGRHSSIDFPLRKIDSVDLNSGIIFADLKIHAGNDVIIMKNASKREGKEFAENLKRITSKVNNQISIAPSSPESQALDTDIAAKIIKLTDLKAQGILTKYQFNEQIQKLLELDSNQEPSDFWID